MDISPTIQHLHGRLRSITGPDPAANVQISETVPDRRRWRLLSFRFAFTCDANVADRTVTLAINDGTSTLYYLPSDTVQVATQLRTYYYHLQPVPQYIVGTNFQLPLPPILLTSGFKIITATANMQAGDDFAAPQFLVEEWIDP